MGNKAIKWYDDEWIVRPNNQYNYNVTYKFKVKVINTLNNSYVPDTVYTLVVKHKCSDAKIE